MKKSEFEARRKAAWNVRMIRNLGTVNALIETDLEAAEAAGVMWDREVEELGEIAVDDVGGFTYLSNAGGRKLLRPELVAVARFWNAGVGIERALCA